MSPYVVSNEVLNRKVLSQYHVYKKFSLIVVWVVSGGVGPRKRRGPAGGRIWMLVITSQETRSVMWSLVRWVARLWHLASGHTVRQ